MSTMFDRLGQQAPQQPRGKSREEALREIKADPVGVLRKHGLSVPAGATDPMQMVNHLIQTGQVGGPKLQMVQQMMNRMGRR